MHLQAGPIWKGVKTKAPAITHAVVIMSAYIVVAALEDSCCRTGLRPFATLSLADVLGETRGKMTRKLKPLLLPGRFELYCSRIPRQLLGLFMHGAIKRTKLVTVATRCSHLPPPTLDPKKTNRFHSDDQGPSNNRNYHKWPWRHQGRYSMIQRGFLRPRRSISLPSYIPHC